MPGKTKFDGVIEAVHYRPDGEVAWVRLFERRGPTFSDHVILDRQALIARLKAGKRIVVGKRISYMASTFDVAGALRLGKIDGEEFLLFGAEQAQKDALPGVPVI